MKKISYLKIALLGVGLSLLLWNCKDDHEIIENQQTQSYHLSIEEIQTAFAKEFNPKKYPHLKQPLWEHANSYVFDTQIPYIEVPFKLINYPHLKQATSISLDKLLAFKDANGNLHISIVHFFAIDLNKGVPNFNVITHKNTNHFNGFITLFTLANKSVLSSAKYKNGQKLDVEVMYKTPEDLLDVKQNYRMYEQCYTEETTCERTCLVLLGSNGDLEQILGCSAWSCYTNGGYLTSCGDGDGNASYTDYETNYEENIVDKTNNPCVSSIINALKEKDMNGTLIPDLSGKSHLSQVILDLFNDSRKYNLTFNIGQLDYLGTGVNGNTNGFDITLDTDIVRDATQLFIAKTIIHESLHAYLHYVVRSEVNSSTTVALKEYLKHYSQTSNNTSITNLTEHEFMGQYVEALAYSLSVYDNHRQPMEYYKALSWGGLHESSAYQSLNNKAEIQKIIENEKFSKNDAKSSKCN